MVLTNESSEFGKVKPGGGVSESKPTNIEKELEEKKGTPEPEKDDGNPGGGALDVKKPEEPFVPAAEMFVMKQNCQMCGSGVPHLVVTIDKDTDKIFVHAPFGKKWLMNEMMDAIKKEFDKRNAPQK